MREKCYKCKRPKSSCLCKHCSPIATQTKFVILMHPMEYKKVKNGTGFITHLQLSNSEIIVDVSFTQNKRVNELIEKYDAYILYPGITSISLNNFENCESLGVKRLFFLLDATWPCAKKMMKLSPNLQALPKVSFEVKKNSDFSIKQQPHELCLSTIESVDEVLKVLGQNLLENVDTKNFLKPFNELVKYQLECIERDDNKNYRPYLKKRVQTKTKYKVDPERSIFYEEKNFS